MRRHVINSLLFFSLQTIGTSNENFCSSNNQNTINDGVEKNNNNFKRSFQRNTDCIPSVDSNYYKVRPLSLNEMNKVIGYNKIDNEHDSSIHNDFYLNNYNHIPLLLHYDFKVDIKGEYYFRKLFFFFG